MKGKTAVAQKSAHTTTPPPARTTARLFFQRAETSGGQQAFFHAGAQAKLTMGRSGDKFEREADKVADVVVGRAPGRHGAAPPITPVTRGDLRREPPVQKADEKKEQAAQAKADELQPKQEEKELQSKSEGTELPSRGEEKELQSKDDDKKLQLKDEEKDLQTKEEKEEVQTKGGEKDLQAKDEEDLQARDDKEVQAKAEEKDVQAKDEDKEVQSKDDEKEVQAKAEEKDVQAKDEEKEIQSKDDEKKVQAKDDKQDLQAKDEDKDIQAKDEKDLQAKDEDKNLQALEDDKDKPPVQARGEDGALAPVDVEDKLRASRGGGQKLPEQVRSRMEAGIGADFSGVTIHTDGLAVQLTQLLKAQAFTHGRDIYFNANKFSPASPSGEHLLAHELTHTIQQGAAKAKEVQLQPEPDTSPRPDDAGATIQIRPELLEAIKLARGEIGKVNAKKTNADATRVGWDRLAEYFFTAFGDKALIHENVIKFLTTVKDPAGKSKDAMPSWCGIFVWWAYKKAGLPIPDWKLGMSVLGHTRIRKPGELPRKGDIAYREKFDHFALVTGVESPADSAGKDFKAIRVATINGNTSGNDNIGGQIEEKWEPISKWLAFFDPLGKLDLPPVPLIATSVTPDEREAAEAGAAPEALAEPAPEKPLTDVGHLQESVASEPDTPAAEDTAIELELPPPLPKAEEPAVTGLPPRPPAPPLEKAAKVEELPLEGPSDQAMVGFTKANPSQMAKTQPVLGGKLDGKLQGEQKSEVENAPILVAKTNGTVDEGLTPPSEIPVPADAQIGDGVTGTDPGALQATPHTDRGPAPSTEQSRKKVEDQEDGGFFGWLRDNFKSLISGISTRDPGVNTSAGERPNVALEGEADPTRMANQRADANVALRAERDGATEALKNNPGQQNIQPKLVNEEKAAAPTAETSVEITTAEDSGAAEYADAPLSADVRAKADELLKPDVDAHMAEATQQTEQAADERDTDKQAEITKAEDDVAKANANADKDQRDIVVKNRGEVAKQQKDGIEQAYDQVNAFNKEADTEHTEARKAVGDKVKDSEGKAREELDKGETDAQAEKAAGEKEAEDKKKELEEKEDDESWWDRAVNVVKDAVKAITSAIDAVFTAVRNAVKTIIEKAKNAAIGLINAARDWVVDKLNKFRDWAKDMVNTYLKDRFPGLAKKINGAIDTVVDGAITGVNAVADAAIKAVEVVAGALAAALDKILQVFQVALKAAVAIAGAVITGDFAEALRIAIQAACEIAGIDPKPVFDFIDRAKAQIMKILKDPVPFFNNLMEAVGGGVDNFVKNIKKHLINGLIGWLTGALADTPIKLPATLDGPGIFSLIMQILGLTYENIKAKLIKKFPPAAKIIAVIEKGVTLIDKLRREGPMALWEEAKAALSNLGEIVIGGIRSFVIDTVVKEAFTWLIGLLNPAGALVKVVKLLFDFVMFLIERFQQIKDFVMSVYEGIVAIASGTLDPAKKAVEDALARSLPVVISLLASLAGLGGIGKKVQEIIKKITTPIDKVIDKILDFIIKFAKKIIAKVTAGAKKLKEKLVSWWKKKKGFEGKDGKPHTLFLKGSEKSATLTVRSEEQPFSRFLEWSGAQQKTPEQIAALPLAKAAAKKIDDEKSTPIDKSLPEDKKKEEAKKKSDRLDSYFDELLPQTAILFGGGDLPKCLTPEYGNLNDAGFGTGMKIKVLTRQEMPEGSEPSQAAQTVYDKLNLRRKAGGSFYYVRGHLLNHNISGPGEWNNMTPLTLSGNHQHEAQVESLVKAGVKSGAIMEYNVKPTYVKRGGSIGLIAEARKGRTAQGAIDIQEIVKAEDFVPEKLEISAHRMERNGPDSFKKVKSQSWTVANPVERTPDSYHLLDSRKITPVRINDLKDASPLMAAGFPADLQAAAGSIVLAVQARRAGNQPNFGEYRVLAREAKTFTEAQAKSWNEDGFIVL